MALSERLALIVSLDAQGAIRGLNQVGATAQRELGKTENRTDRMAKGFQKAGVGMLATAGIIGAGLYKAGQSAADLEQAVGGTEAVFDDSAATIDRYAKGAARNMGLSERAFREATTRIGGSLKGLGFQTDDAADKAVELTGVASDLAATYGGTTADAVDALAAAFRGEADPAERFNLFLNQNRVNAKAVALGLAETTSQVDANAKAQATLALITEQSADALGQFGREAGSASGSMAIANAEFENAKAALGESVAPILADVAGGLSKVAGGFQSANEKSGGFLSKLAAVGTIGLGAAGGLSFVVGKVISMRENLGKLAGPLRNAEGGLSRLGKVGALGGIAAGVGTLAVMANSMNDASVNVDDLAAKLGDLDSANKTMIEQNIVAAREFGNLDDVVSQLANENVIAADRFLEVAESMGITGDELADLKQIVDDKRASDVQGAADQQKYAEEIQKTIPPTEGLTGAISEQEEALNSLLDATLAQFDANVGYRRSVDEVEGSLADLNEAQKEHGSNSEEYRDALLDAEAALLEQADAAVRLWEDTVTAAGGTTTAKEKTNLYRDELARLRDSLAPNSPLRKVLQGYIDQLASIPASVETVVRPVVSGVRANQLLSGQRASGGSVLSGSTYLVGERGPELFTATSAGSITPTNELMAGGGNTYQVTVVAWDTKDGGQAVVEAIAAYEKTNGRVYQRAS